MGPAERRAVGQRLAVQGRRGARSRSAANGRVLIVITLKTGNYLSRVRGSA